MDIVRHNIAGWHILMLTAVGGMTYWVTFFGGPLQYKALPRHMFGSLQSKVFPVYFGIGTLLSSALTFTFTRLRPDSLKGLALDPRRMGGSSWQLVGLGVAAAAYGVNWAYVGPLTTKVIFDRHKIENKTGQDAYQTRPEKLKPDLKQLNMEFARLHGMSSALNLAIVGSLTYHALWLGRYLSDTPVVPAIVKEL
ncbi:hypothetical protein BZG36_04514 [Bifiguratus adelaidae]|uniref:TMEM205-like domain-containing protein n=1 Tax=Bifiguratus adelaidae TaxID=1938954 RepID=A0A261XXJ9_9FUNG|nr:hypothetical protein BZG36_04514 [Bifiguratus adelaidae]